MHNTRFPAVIGLGCLALFGCALRDGSEPDGSTTQDQTESTEQAIQTFHWTVFDNPYGDGTPNPAAGVRGVARGYVSTNPNVVSGLKAWTVTGIDVFGLPPNRTFGAHAHVATCDNGQGGGHYQNEPGVVDPVASEIWLDFTTDSRGWGNVKVLSPFGVRPGGVQSFVIHTNPTDANGKAGAKLACANLNLTGP
jgi:Cu-Zn family superoxide dismutase